MNEGILLVEDDDDIREALKELLDAECCRVDTAPNGREAMRCLESRPLPSLIILDLLMPVMDGFEFRERQRRNPAWSQIPVAVLSAVGAEYARENRLGAVAYLSKPSDPDALLKLARQYC